MSVGICPLCKSTIEVPDGYDICTCGNCGQQISTSVAKNLLNQPVASDSSVPTELTPDIPAPASQQANYVSTPQAQQAPNITSAPPVKNGKATASLVCGIVGLLILGIILGIIAIVTGNQALKIEPDNKKAKAGRILGIIDIVAAIFLVILRFS